MDSFEKFNQTELPAKEHFYNILNDQDITNDEYDHAEKVWKTFKLKNLGEYHDLYLEIKLELMTDVDMFQFIEKGMCCKIHILHCE